MNVDEVKQKKVVVTTMDGKDVVLYEMGGEIKCHTAICTHRGCTVEYDAASNTLPCPCHGSVYTVEGQVVEGPAAQPLAPVNIKIEGNEIKLA